MFDLSKVFLCICQVSLAAQRSSVLLISYSHTDSGREKSYRDRFNLASAKSAVSISLGVYFRLVYFRVLAITPRSSAHRVHANQFTHQHTAAGSLGAAIGATTRPQQDRTRRDPSYLCVYEVP